ncbi:MAG: hypothetical protein WCW36_00040 [Candidatus Paceibacterota bacterium]|jgi:hypothetical protein
MKIMIFTEGTILMHKNASGLTREEIVKQVQDEESSVHDYSFYIPVGNAVNKIKLWQDQGAEILYLTSRKRQEEIKEISGVLKKYDFPEGKLLSRKDEQEYKDVAEETVPDIFIEDDCESIGGINEMTYTHISSDLKGKIKSIPVKEFGGIDYLPDSVKDLKTL